MVKKMSQFDTFQSLVNAHAKNSKLTNPKTLDAITALITSEGDSMSAETLDLLAAIYYKCTPNISVSRIKSDPLAWVAAASGKGDIRQYLNQVVVQEFTKGVRTAVATDGYRIHVWHDCCLEADAYNEKTLLATDPHETKFPDWQRIVPAVDNTMLVEVVSADLAVVPGKAQVVNVITRPADANHPQITASMDGQYSTHFNKKYWDEAMAQMGEGVEIRMRTPADDMHEDKLVVWMRDGDKEVIIMPMRKPA